MFAILHCITNLIEYFPKNYHKKSYKLIIYDLIPFQSIFLVFSHNLNFLNNKLNIKLTQLLIVIIT